MKKHDQNSRSYSSDSARVNTPVLRNNQPVPSPFVNDGSYEEPSGKPTKKSSKKINKKQFHVNNIENSIIFSKETIISFGEDLVIKNNYLKNNNSYSKFPSSYGNNNDSILDFCGDSKLEILELEIFNILDY